MRPTPRQLEYIVAVADTGSVGAAADLLNVSQPSLSAQLSEVEADLGIKLFLRGLFRGEDHARWQEHRAPCPPDRA